MIGVRIKEERSRLGLNQPDFAEIAGVSKRTLIDWEKDSSSPNAVHLSALSQAGVDVHYIITGKKLDKENESLLGEGIDGFGLVPVHEEVMISAGHGGVLCAPNQPSGFMAFRNDWIRSRGFSVKDLKVFITRGDSMSPTIEDKEPILINTAEKDPQDGHIYVIRSGEMIWVKRIQRQIDGSLLLISDNKLYPPMSIKLDESTDVDVIGKVVNSSKNFY
ncbi:XRE family transcriptional regulator [Acinetobacter johnsonii]|uniref:XRE family transcriptional regulator n=1 Tax=Acinetobacter johnsonii TaxID=40214 RepID=UPI001039B80B|nr:XRE family transcriptional regulator [Acinetobacter johnsonii]QBK70694.1 XRE family transcriptional regulator [Acinetobacter johnsonii]